MGLLKRIDITDLFGHYSYNLPFITQHRRNICFLTGPNGYGKSTILRLIYAFMKADSRMLLSIPYNSLTFYLKDYTVHLYQERIEETSIIDANQVSDDVDEVCTLTIIVRTADGGEELERVSFSEKDLEDESIGSFPPSLSVYLASVDVEYIPDDRLLPQNADKSGITDSVGFLQRLLAKYDTHLIECYNRQLLIALRSFSSEDFTHGELEEQGLLKRAEEKLIAFNKFGLAKQLIDPNIQADNHLMFMFQMAALDKVLSFDDIIYQRISLLYEIIVSSEFSDKSLVLDPKNGLFFISGDTIIIPEELSSGEQHFIIQLITLLMKAENGSLILIDEPELSYHPAWQLDYLKNLRKIATLGEYQFILATHSPQIFDYRWGYTIDLFKQTTKDAEGSETLS